MILHRDPNFTAYHSTSPVFSIAVVLLKGPVQASRAVVLHSIESDPSDSHRVACNSKPMVGLSEVHGAFTASRPSASAVTVQTRL